MSRLTLSEQVQSLTSQLASAQSQVSSLEADNKAYQGQLAHLRIEVSDLRAQALKVERLEKELETNKSSNTYNRELAARYKDELDQAHAVLDGVEGAPGRKLEGDYSGERSLITRLAGTFMAIAKMGRV